MNSIQKIKRYIIISMLLLLAYSCAVKKYVPKDEFLYRGASIHVNDSLPSEEKDILQAKLDNLLYPNPNFKLLGLYPSLHYYYKAQQEHPGFINKFLNKKIGEEPVYLSDVDLPNTEDLIFNRLENNGFFGSRVNSSVEIDSSGKTARAAYEVAVPEPYRMANDTYEIETDSLDSLPIFDRIRESLSETLIKKNNRFSLARFTAERQRIEAYLKKKGYYNFNSNFLIFEADTNRYKDRRYDLFLKVKNEVPDLALVPYKIDEVNVYPNTSLKKEEQASDTVVVDSVNYIQDELFFKPKRLAPYVLINPGQLYSPKLSKYTSRRISSIGAYKFVNIQYNQTDSITDSLGFRHLKNDIYLSPLNKRAIRLELQGVTKSNNFVGPGIAATYTNRNLFKGGEILNLTGSLAYEQQFSSGDQSGLRSIEVGFKPTLVFPRLLFPINIDNRFKYAIPKTKISAGVSYLDRSKLYTLTSFSTSFGYIWQANRYVTHKLNPINIDYVRLGNTSQEFEDILHKNQFLRQSFEQQFIAGLTYSFTYNELVDQNRRGKFYFNFNFDIAGNTISLFGKDNEDGIKTFLGLKYAQYAKADIDVRYHYDVGHSGQVLVGRIFAGAGLPYGNSKVLPFVKQYFSGGPYSVRAFKIRSLGPGSYKPEEVGNSYFDRAGDIRLEANLEFRFPIISFLKGAIFADAGNVWLMNKNKDLLGGEFESDFYKELGIGTGIGLRVDIQSFVIRFDLAAPLKSPTTSWDFQYDEPVFNFAIGYPF